MGSSRILGTSSIAQKIIKRVIPLHVAFAWRSNKFEGNSEQIYRSDVRGPTFGWNLPKKGYFLKILQEPKNAYENPLESFAYLLKMMNFGLFL